MPERPTRRKVLLASGAATGALSGCLSMAQGQPDGCVPPGQYECPDGSEFLAKLELQGCSFTQEEGDCSVSVTVTEAKDDDGCEPLEFEWAVADDGCEVSAIRVYGGSDCEDHDPDAAIEGTVTTDLGAGRSDQQAAISNVIFCGETTAEETPEETPEDTPEETPEETPENTPEDTPEETPEDTPEGTPEDTPEQTPEETPEETPTDTDGDKEEKDDSEASPC